MRDEGRSAVSDLAGCYGHTPDPVEVRRLADAIKVGATGSVTTTPSAMASAQALAIRELRAALLSLHRTAEILLDSEHEDERGTGAALGEVTRIVVDLPDRSSEQSANAPASTATNQTPARESDA
jgi:hypothetical protein